MAVLQYNMTQLVNLAIGTPEVGAVNFKLLQKVLLEILKLTELDSVTVPLSPEETEKIMETSSIKPLLEEPHTDEDRGSKSSIKRHQCPIDPEKVDRLLEDMNQVKFDLEDLASKVGNMTASTETVPFKELHSSISNIDAMNKKIKNMEGQMELLKDLDLAGSDERTLGQRFVHLEKHVIGHSEQLENINNVLDDKLKNIIERFTTMEKDLGIIYEKMNIAESSAQLQRGSKGASQNDVNISSVLDQSASINNLVCRLSTVQQDLDKMTVQMSSMQEEQEQRQMVIDVLTEQIDLLKLVKADKINVEDVLAAKADLSQVHRKVSHDQFENKMVKLNELLEEALARLDAHEEIWQEEVEFIKTDIENKLDRAEFAPMKDYVNERLKLLQDKMKVLINQAREGPAAGTKKRLIKDVQCISCDNESVMKPEINFDDMTPPPALPVHQSVKPYLTYELDKVRRQQKRLPGKNLLHFEEIMKEGKEAPDVKIVSSKPSRTPDHLQSFDKITREGREAFLKGFFILEKAFGSLDQPAHIEDLVRQGREAYLKGQQLFVQACRLPTVNTHNVENLLKECRDAHAKAHKLIEHLNRSPDKYVASVDELMVNGEMLYSNCLSTPGFNIENLDEVMAQYQQFFEKGLKMLNSATRIPNHGSFVRKCLASSPRGVPSGEQLVNRYVGGSHTKTTAQQRVSRPGNFYETWGPIITAVRPPEQSKA